MRHVVSHAQDGHIQMALVDEESGELDQIGQFIWPDGFGLTESAVLSTNLTAFFGLNGKRPTRGRSVTEAIEAPSPRQALPAPVRPAPGAYRSRNEMAQRREDLLAFLRQHPGSTIGQMGKALGVHEVSNSWVRKTLIQWLHDGVLRREGEGGTINPHRYTLIAEPTVDVVDDQPQLPLTQRGTPRKRARPDSRNRVQAYISLGWIVDTVADYPDGITAKQIAERIWRTQLGRDGPMQRWCSRSVENRLAMVQADAKRGKPMPFGIDYRPMVNAEGQLLKQTAKYIVPLGVPS